MKGAGSWVTTRPSYVRKTRGPLVGILMSSGGGMIREMLQILYCMLLPLTIAVKGMVVLVWWLWRRRRRVLTGGRRYGTSRWGGAGRRWFFCCSKCHVRLLC